jgi:hypothetical protein
VRRLLWIATALAASAVPAPSAFPRGEERVEALRAQFAGKQRGILVEAGTRFVEVGIWCRDAGLVAQATAEFLRAVEISEGGNAWAVKVVAIMRSLDDKFWKSFRNEKPSKGMLAGHEKRAKAAFAAYRKDRLGLARWADKQGLLDEAYGEYVGVLRALGAPLEVDAQGRVLLEGTPLPAAISSRLRDDAVSINDRLYVRDEFLELVPQVESVHQAETEALRVRTEKGGAEAAGLLALALAAMAHLEDEVGGRPTQRLNVYVFQAKDVYASFLRKTGMASHTAATGVADGARRLVLVCAEGLSEETVRSLVLHELAHLFQYAVTPVVMPSWYSEGFAESFGGEGGYAWDGVTLRYEGEPPADRIAPLKTDAGYIPLERLLEADALETIQKDAGLARRFYAESWAFYRYMKSAAPKEVASRFALWEAMCRGQALGAEAGKPASRDAAPAGDLFRARLGGDLAAIEKGFRAWLASR